MSDFDGDFGLAAALFAIAGRLPWVSQMYRSEELNGMFQRGRLTNMNEQPCKCPCEVKFSSGRVSTLSEAQNAQNSVFFDVLERYRKSRWFVPGKKVGLQVQVCAGESGAVSSDFPCLFG